MKRAFKNKFTKDLLFGHRFMCILDQYFQRFLSKYLLVNSIVDVNPSYFDMPYISQSFVHFRFSCDLRSSFSNVSKLSLVPVRSPITTDKELDRCHKNELARLEQMLPKSTKFADIFSPELQKSTPVFKGGCQCCPRWGIKVVLFHYLQK